MYKVLLSLLSFLAFTGIQPLCAQGVHFKFGGGLASHYGKAKAVGAFKAGVGYEIELDQHWSFLPTFEVYGKGWKDANQEVFVFDDAGNQLFDQETGEPLVGIMSRSATQNYVQVPLLFAYYWRTGESRYLVMSAGPYVAYGVAGKQTTKGDTTRPGSEKMYYEKKTFKEPGTHRFDAGIQASVGYQFPSGVLVGLEADFGLAKFNRAGDRNISGLITLGYRLK